MYHLVKMPFKYIFLYCVRVIKLLMRPHFVCSELNGLVTVNSQDFKALSNVLCQNGYLRHYLA